MSVVVEYLFLACALLFRHAPFAVVEQTSEIETPTALRHFWQGLHLRLDGFFERYPAVRRRHNLHSLQRIDVGNEEYGNFIITVLSFGFKYGIPSDADLVFDVRFLPNPYYVDELRPLTGLDDRVFNYVMDCDIARTFADKLEDMINFLIPNYVKEGKTNLVIAIGCTGGKHRSVTLARELYSRLSGNTKYGFRLEHRDAQKDRLVRKQEG